MRVRNRLASPSSSAPVPIPRATPNGEKRAPLSSPSSSTPIPTSPTPSPPTHLSTARVAASSPPTVDDSPLSRASIIVNPPTPSVEPTRIKNSSANEQTRRLLPFTCQFRLRLSHQLVPPPQRYVPTRI